MAASRSAEQAKYLARYAREWAASWPAEARKNYAGELTLGSAYSGYRVVDGRCIAVRRRSEDGSVRVLTSHEALDCWLVGYLSSWQDQSGSWRFTLHRSLRDGCKAVLWRPSQHACGDFVVTSRIESLRVAPRITPEIRVAATPTGGVHVPPRPGLPARRPIPGRVVPPPPPPPRARPQVRA